MVGYSGRIRYLGNTRQLTTLVASEVEVIVSVGIAGPEWARDLSKSAEPLMVIEYYR